MSETVTIPTLRERIRPELWLRFGIAAVLGMAAGMKVHQLATTPILGEGLFNARWFNIFVVEFELFFAVWLLFGLLPNLTWLATAGLFSAFASVSLLKAVLGETDCGCWGAAKMNPWYTTVFDISVVGLLIAFRPTGVRFRWKEVCQELLVRQC